MHRLWLVGLVVITWPFAASAQPTPTKLLDPEGAADDHFGWSVGLSGQRAIVGAPDDADVVLGALAGSSTVFRRDGAAWVHEQKLLDPEGAAGDRFGAAVAISGTAAIIGAPDDGDPVLGASAGSATIFRYNGSSWVREQKLVDPDGAAGDHFGYSVAIEGDVAIVGAPDDGHPALGPLAGSATIFRYNGSSWMREQKLVDPGGAADDHFGFSVAVGSNLAIVGAPDDDDALGDLVGSVTIFRHDGSAWAHESKLLGIEPDDRFGYSVAVNADVMVGGSPFDDIPGIGIDCGSANVFRHNGTAWLFEQELFDPLGGSGDGFGVSVAIRGNTVVVGADLDDVSGPDDGSAAIFKHDGSSWVHQQRLLNPPDAGGSSTRDQFGCSVALSGTAVIVGAFSDNDPILGFNAGSITIFEDVRDPCPCDLDGQPGVDVFDLLTYLDCWFTASTGQECP